MITKQLLFEMQLYVKNNVFQKMKMAMANLIAELKLLPSISSCQ